MVLLASTLDGGGIKECIMIIHTNYYNLDDAIDYFEKLNGYSPYVFINKETIKEHCWIINPFSVANSTLEYYGCRVFEDNTLDFHEVILR